MVGVEDGGFTRESGIEEALLVTVLLQGTAIIGFQEKNIKVDGLDATEKLISMLRHWSFDGVILAGVSFAGFNLIDAHTIFEEFKKPVLIVARTKPNNVAVREALLEHFADWKTRLEIIERLGPVYEIVSLPDEPPLYVEVVGADLIWARNLIREFSVCCRVPEPIRVARLIARGLTPRVWKS